MNKDDRQWIQQSREWPRRSTMNNCSCGTSCAMTILNGLSNLGNDPEGARCGTYLVIPAMPETGDAVTVPPLGHDAVVKSRLAGVRRTPRLHGTDTATRARYGVLGSRDPGARYCSRLPPEAASEDRTLPARSSPMDVPAASRRNRDQVQAAPEGRCPVYLGEDKRHARAPSITPSGFELSWRLRRYAATTNEANNYIARWSTQPRPCPL